MTLFEIGFAVCAFTNFVTKQSVKNLKVSIISTPL